MSTLAAALLSQTIDDHIVWMTAWSRQAFFEPAATRAEPPTMPESFTLWRSEAAKTMQDQPALIKIVDLYDQLHRTARLVLLKSPDGLPIAASDYDSVVLKYQELVLGLRRVERALASADSGLDPLTGLRSRIGMRDDLTRELSRYQRSGKPFCLALMDLDHFKAVNDKHGHENGDRVLMAVSNLLSRNLRPFDDAWRWGGEEFLLCLKEVDLIAGGLALERVRAAIEKLPIKLDDGRSIFITASFGLVTSTKESTTDSLMEHADKALYRAKNGGRNRIVSAY